MNRNPFILKNVHPETSLVWGYISYTIAGVFILSLPWFRLVPVEFLDNLFISVSAISTTGLATISVPDSYTIAGQIVVLLLIQLGGIGYMTFGSFIVLSTSRTISEGRQEIHKTAFSLPRDFSIKKFVRSVVVYTFFIELIGAVVLSIVFFGDDRVNFIWSGIFHSVSSFCTAGFSLYNNSFESYAANIPLNITVTVLSFLGAIGYIVMVDVWLILKRKRDSLTFTSRIILFTTFILFSLGFFLIYLDGFLKNGHREGDFLTALFQSMTALTTVGFNTVPIGGLKSFSLFVLLILMIIGASPSGTGGGIKSTTVSGIIWVLKSVFSFRKEYINYHLPVRNSESEETAGKKDKPLLKGLTKLWHFKKKTVAPPKVELPDEEPDSELEKILGDIFKIKLAGRTIPFDRVIHAIATFSFYFIILFAGILLLLLSEPFGFEQIFFEAASALGTVGLSTGITGNLSEPGKLILILLMFIGRLGPITFGVFLFSRKPKTRPANEMEDLVV